MPHASPPLGHGSDPTSSTNLMRADLESYTMYGLQCMIYALQHAWCTIQQMYATVHKSVQSLLHLEPGPAHFARFQFIQQHCRNLSLSIYTHLRGVCRSSANILRIGYHVDVGIPTSTPPTLDKLLCLCLSSWKLHVCLH